MERSGGVFELESFSKGTKEIGIAIAESTKSGAFSLVGEEIQLLQLRSSI